MITIIGAGPAGLLTAREASSLGQEVVVYEEHSEIGKPVQCAGLVSKSGLNALKVDYEDLVLNEISRARMYSPSGKHIELKKSKGYALVIDREGFDKEIAREAESEGAKIVLGKRIEKIPEGTVVGADGASSLVARKLGIKRDYLIAYQIENRMKFDQDMVELHFGPWAPGFFAWVIPVDEKRTRVGLAYNPEKARELGDYDPRLGLKFFLKERGYPYDPISELGGLIPVYDGRPAVYGRIALVGDAAAQVKASTGGGIVIGGQCALMLGRVLGEDRPLADYEKAWKRRFKKELSIHLAIHRFYSRLSYSEFEEIFDLMDPELLRIVEKRMEMEDVSKGIPDFMRYAVTHPTLAMRLYKYMKYVDLSLLRI